MRLFERGASEQEEIETPSEVVEQTIRRYICDLQERGMYKDNVIEKRGKGRNKTGIREKTLYSCGTAATVKRDEPANYHFACKSDASVHYKDYQVFAVDGSDLRLLQMRRIRKHI